MTARLGAAVARGLSLAFLGALSAATASCDGCSKHKPFVPFDLEAGPARAVPHADGDAAASSPAAVPIVDAGHLEVPASTLVVDGLVFQAPDGRLLTDVVSQGDAHGGALLAIARDAAGLKPDTVVAYAYDKRNAGAPVTVAEGPPIPADERCVQDARIRFSGRSSAVARWRLRCPSDVASEPASVLAVVEVGPRPAVRLRVAFRDPVLDMPLDLDADAADADEDGQDDLALTVRVEPKAPYTRAPTPVVFKWLARAAGASPVPGASSEAWRGLARDLAARAEERNPGVFDAIAGARTLVDALCGSAPTVRVEVGGRLEPCDAKGLGATLDALERKALVARNDALLWAAFLATNPPPSPEVTLLEKGLAKSAPERALREVRREEPSAEGDATVDAGATAPALDAAPGAGAFTLESVEDRCTGSLSARVARAGLSFDVTLPLRSERRRGEGSGCAIEAIASGAHRVVASSDHALVALVRGRLIAIEAVIGDAADAGGADAPIARLAFPSSEGVGKLFAASPVVLRVGSSVIVAQRAVERLALPKDADASIFELWPPTACAATDVPRVLRCQHPAGALFVTLPGPAKGPKEAGGAKGLEAAPRVRR